jgi:hypothetical protein
MRRFLFVAIATFACGISKAQVVEPLFNVSGGLNSALHASLVVDGGIKINDFLSVAGTATGSTQGIVMPGVFAGIDLGNDDKHTIFTPYIGANMLFYKEQHDGEDGIRTLNKIYPLFGVRMTHFRAIAFDIRYTGYNASVSIGWAFAGRKEHK